MTDSDLRSLCSNDGFTIVEMIVSMVLMLVVVTAALSVGNTTLQVSTVNQVNEDLVRNARFLRATLERDFLPAGVGLESSRDFGSVGVHGDTVAIFSVPFDSVEAPAYRLPTDIVPLGPGQGTCGRRCLEVMKGNGNFDIKSGDLARIQIHETVRLVVVKSVTLQDSTALVSWRATDPILGFPAGLAASGPYSQVMIDPGTTFLQELAVSVFFVESGKLFRAGELNLDGLPVATELGRGLSDWQVALEFLDGDIFDRAHPTGSDDSDDYDDILSVLIAADVGPEYSMHGAGRLRTFEWKFTPRNLMYERNRIR